QGKDSPAHTTAKGMCQVPRFKPSQEVFRDTTCFQERITANSIYEGTLALPTTCLATFAKPSPKLHCVHACLLRQPGEALSEAITSCYVRLNTMRFTLSRVIGLLLKMR